MRLWENSHKRGHFSKKISTIPKEVHKFVGNPTSKNGLILRDSDPFWLEISTFDFQFFIFWKWAKIFVLWEIPTNGSKKGAYTPRFGPIFAIFLFFKCRYFKPKSIWIPEYGPIFHFLQFSKCSFFKPKSIWISEYKPFLEKIPTNFKM